MTYRETRHKTEDGRHPAAGESEGKRNRRPALRLLVLLILTALVFVVYVALGSVRESLATVVREILRPDYTSGDYSIIWTVRLPRACGCLLVGAILGMVGSAFQSLFRNPLAEPYIVGVSSGAAVGGAIALVTGFGASWTGLAFGLGKTVLAFPAGLAVLGLVFGVSRRRGVLDVQTLLLAGVVVGAMLSALLSYILLAGGRDQRIVLQWLLGSFSDLNFGEVGVMALFLLVGGVLLILQTKNLNAYAFGEEAAQRLGVDVARLKSVVLVAGTAMVAATVGPVGIIGFVGLVAPHLARRTVAVDWRWSLLGSALIGCILLLAADLGAQHAIANGELPVGIVTAIIGAPFLLIVLRKE